MSAATPQLIVVRIPLNLLPPTFPSTPTPSSTLRYDNDANLLVTTSFASESQLDPLPISSVTIAATSDPDFLKLLAKTSSSGVTISGVTLHDMPIQLDWTCSDVGIVNNTNLTATKLVLSATKLKGGTKLSSTVTPPLHFNNTPPASVNTAPATLTPYTPNRGSPSRVSDVTATELALSRRRLLWCLLDDLAGATNKTQGGEAKAEVKEDAAGTSYLTKSQKKRLNKKKNASKQHNKDAIDAASSSLPPPAPTNVASANSMFTANLNSLLRDNESIYGKGYGTSLRSYIAKMQDDIKEDRRSYTSCLPYAQHKHRTSPTNVASSDPLLQQLVTYDVLVKVLAQWEKDERHMKQNALETTPPRSVAKHAFFSKLDVDDDDDDTQTVLLKFDDVVMESDIDARTNPADVVRQFMAKYTETAASPLDNQAVDEMKASLADQMAPAQSGLMSRAVSLMESRLQDSADKVETVEEILEYYLETLDDPDNEKEVLEKKEVVEKEKERFEEQFEPQMKKIASQLLKTKKQLRTLQKRRMTMGTPPAANGNSSAPGGGRRASSLFSTIMNDKLDSPNIDELFNYVDGDGDGSIDEQEWREFTIRRKEMQAKHVLERNKLMATQKLLKERMKGASKVCKENERLEREYLSKKEGMVEMLVNLASQNESLKEQIAGGNSGGGAGGGRESHVLQIEKFARVILDNGLDKFARILDSAILDDSDDEDEYVTPSALRLALGNMNIDHGAFDLRDICYFYGKQTRGLVTKKGIVDGIRLYAE